MKKLAVVVCLLVMSLCLTSCTYNYPKGWTQNHHTYMEILQFAKSMDPNATVLLKHVDSEDEKVAFEQAEKMVQALDAAGKEYKFVRYEDDVHGGRPEDFQIIMEWCK